MSYLVSVEGTEPFREDTAALIRGLRSPEPLMRRIGAYGASSTVRRIAEGVGPDNAPLTQAFKKGSNTPLRDTGKLMGGITHRAGRTWAAWGSNDVQARILQLGGTIRPKKAKKLAVPFDWWTRQMMRRYGETPGRCIKAMRASGDWNVWTSRRGRAVLAKRKTAAGKGKVRVLFVLMDALTIPARQYLRLDARDRDEIAGMTLHYFSTHVPGHA